MADIIGALLSIVGSGLSIVGEALPEKAIGQANTVNNSVGGDPKLAGYTSGIYSGINSKKNKWTSFEKTDWAKGFSTAGSIIGGTGASGIFDKDYSKTPPGETNTKLGGDVMDSDVPLPPEYNERKILDNEYDMYAKNGAVITTGDVFSSIMTNINKILQSKM